MKNIRVSVIMPSLNVSAYIEECIKSAIRQTLTDIEIICIDAGSADGTFEILKKYEKLDNRIKVISFGVKSYGAQVNHGISVSQGEYVAILETDDFVGPKMYETLYHAAEQYHVDYAKADYKKFFALANGEYLYSVIKQFEDEDVGLYGKLLDPHTFDYLYKTDFNIWRGIYRREFLIQNEICLNESAGAAYQDIGFMEKVMAAAQKAIYLDKPSYYYRMDRGNASSYSIHGLRNTQFEFKKLMEYFDGSENVYRWGLYLHMMTAFLNEYEKTLKKMNFEFESPECSSYYAWFVNNISQAIEKQVVSPEDMEKKYADKFVLLLKSPCEYAEFLKSEKNKFREYMEKLIFPLRTQILIFGAGHWGYEALKLLKDKRNCHVQAFVDNDDEKQGMIIEDMKVYSLEQAVCKFPTAVIFIANEKYYPEMRIQIEKESKGRVILCPFEWGV